MGATGVARALMGLALVSVLISEYSRGNMTAYSDFYTDTI